jgi:hypothetical protein
MQFELVFSQASNLIFNTFPQLLKADTNNIISSFVAIFVNLINDIKAWIMAFVYIFVHLFNDIMTFLMSFVTTFQDIISTIKQFFQIMADII